MRGDMAPLGFFLLAALLSGSCSRLASAVELCSHARTPGQPATPGQTKTVVTKGIKVTMGLMGKDVSKAVGLAAAEAHLAPLYDKPSMPPIEHYTCCIMGDGKKAVAKATAVSTEVATACIIAIRFLAVNAVCKASCGHPGGLMGQAPTGCCLLAEEMAGYSSISMNIVTKGIEMTTGPLGMGVSNAVGHAAAEANLASVYHKTGILLIVTDHYAYCIIIMGDGCSQEGIPHESCAYADRLGLGRLPYSSVCMNIVTKKGIEVTTDTLGMGVPSAVGRAAAEVRLASLYNRPGIPFTDHCTYCIMGDGCSQEGIPHEPCAYAGHLGPGKLLFVHDDNGITIDDHTELSPTLVKVKHVIGFGLPSKAIIVDEYMRWLQPRPRMAGHAPVRGRDAGPPANLKGHHCTDCCMHSAQVRLTGFCATAPTNAEATLHARAPAPTRPGVRRPLSGA